LQKDLSLEVAKVNDNNDLNSSDSEEIEWKLEKKFQYDRILLLFWKMKISKLIIFMFHNFHFYNNMIIYYLLFIIVQLII